MKMAYQIVDQQFWQNNTLNRDNAKHGCKQMDVEYHTEMQIAYQIVD